MLNAMAANILRHIIAREGINVEFYRHEKNSGGETDYASEPQKTAEIRGVYHDSTSTYNVVTKSDRGRVERDRTPMLLIEYSSGENIRVGDFCNINGMNFNVISLQDVDMANLFLDISLEVVFNV